MVDGCELWHRQINTLQSVSPVELLISGRPDGPYAGKGFEIVPDIVPGCGPLSGIHAALRRAATERILVLAIDLPEMKADFLSSMAWAQESEAAVIPQGARWFEPLAAVYTKACLPLAEECLSGKDFSMQNFARQAIRLGLARIRSIAADEVRLFRNVNSPADL